MPFTPTIVTQALPGGHTNKQNVVYKMPWTAIPNSAAGAVTTTTCELIGLRVINTNGTDATFTFADGSANTYTVTVPASPGPPAGDDTPWGVPCVGGFTILASTTGLICTAAWKY